MKHALAVIAVLFLSQFAMAGIVQSAQCQDWSNWNTSYSCSFTQPTKANNPIIVFALDNSGTAISVTDDASRVYTQDLTFRLGPGGSSGQRMAFYSASMVSSTQTITVSTDPGDKWQVVIMEVAAEL